MEIVPRARDGRAAVELRSLRPDVLVPEILRGERGWMSKPMPYVRTPLTGDSVYVSVNDFRRYAVIAVAFWEDVAVAIEMAG